MSSIADIEDAILDIVRSLQCFQIVDSLGRKSIPQSLNYPACYAYFESDENTLNRPRPVYKMKFVVLVINKNLYSESQSALDTYGLIEAVEQAINGKQLNVADIEPFTCTKREFVDYENGIITYALTFETRHYLDVP